MVQAWQKRDIERRNLIERLIGLSYKEEESVGRTTFRLTIALAIMRYLKERVKEIQEERTPVIGEPDLVRVSDARGMYHFFLRSVQEEITSFARSDAEKDVLFANLLEKMIDVEISLFHNKLAVEEMNEPKKIFNAPSRTTELPEKSLT